MSHDISVSTCSNLQINKLNIRDFNINDYFPKIMKQLNTAISTRKAETRHPHPDSQAKKLRDGY